MAIRDTDLVRNDAAASMPIVITQMRRRHLRGVLRIEDLTSSTPWSLGLFLSEARRPERAYVVALAPAASVRPGSRAPGSKVVGYAGMLFVLGEGHITTVAVDPEAQGGRIGTRLMLVLMRRAIERGSESVTLEVRASNTAALALYRRFGFMPTGARRDYYKDPVEDALVLWAHEIDGDAYAERLDAIEAGLGSPLMVEQIGDSIDDPDDEIPPSIPAEGYL